MSDLYDQIVELQSMADVLTADVGRLQPRLGSRDIQAAVTDDEGMARRLYVRSIFALIEALVERHKLLLLQLAETHVITLKPGVPEALSERVYTVKDNGTVADRDQYLQLLRKLRAVYRAAAEGFGAPLKVEFGGRGWQAFQDAINIRDRLTHPKTYNDCHVSGADLDTVDKAEAWFRSLNIEWVRVATAHRKLHKWG